MSNYNVVLTTNELTVLSKYEPIRKRRGAYQTEEELEESFIKILSNQGYEHREDIKTSEALIENLREQLEKLNNYTFSDNEWDNFYNTQIANPDMSIKDKARIIHEDYIQVLRRDDGTSKNIYLIDKNNIHKNYLQVINQYTEKAGNHETRYDVTILVNGLPLVHTELKRRGVSLREAFNQIDRYQRDSFWAGSGLFEYIQIFVISNGTNTKYYSNTTRFNHVENAESGKIKKEKVSSTFEFTSFWADANNNIIPDLEDFARTFFAKHTLLNILTKYCVFTTNETLLVMRPYQIVAAERIINKVNIANNYNKYSDINSCGYIFHTTGSGKTLTSFKTAQLISQNNYIDKTIFAVDRKDLDYQTMKEFDKFKKGAVNGNRSTAKLKEQLEDDNCRIIVTTIQKLSNFTKKYKNHPVFGKKVVFIFDECHRSQFGKMRAGIVKSFKKFLMYGFTGTPIYTANAGTIKDPTCYTTEQAFGEQLHAYTIINAVNDKNVLPFRIDYIKTMNIDDEITDEKVYDINRAKAYLAPQRISLITEYILNHFAQKTYRGIKYFSHNTITNISDVVSVKKHTTEKYEKRRQNGFNSLFAVDSVKAAMLYYDEFKKQMRKNPDKALRIATIYSYEANESELDELYDDEAVENVDKLDKSSRDFLEGAIQDYNEMFETNYSTDGDSFQNYYRDVSLRVKNGEIDILIVVNMFLTGFDAVTVNTLWVDKNLKNHGLLQAFSRTNRIFNSIKTFGNIVCFRPLQKNVDEAIALFGDKDAGGIAILKGFDDYYSGYTSEDGKKEPGYIDLVETLFKDFPIDEPRIVGEKKQKEFISLFNSVLRMRNLLVCFDEFEDKEILSIDDFQDYLSRYQDLHEEWKNKREKNELKDINDDIVFEIELVKQVDIDIDYILSLIATYHDSNCEDEEVLVKVRKLVNAHPELRSKRMLIEAFIENVKISNDILTDWQKFIAEELERELSEVIKEENLKPDETRILMQNSLHHGKIDSNGTDIDKIMPPVSRFDKDGYDVKKEKILAKLQRIFDKYYGVE